MSTMRWMRNMLPTALCALFAVMMVASCEREPLELYYKGKAQITINIDWESRFGQKPGGMTVMVARLESDSIIYTDITDSKIDVYDELWLEPGTYKILIFNEYFNGFGSMAFGYQKNFDKIYAVAQNQYRTVEFWDNNVSYMREPESIGCAVDTFTVLPEMIDGKPRFVYYKDKVPNEFEGVTLNETIEPMETEMFVRVRVLGIKYMTKVIGNISGMSDGFLLTQAWRRAESGYHLLDNWKISDITYENGDTLRSVGYVSTTIRTFGLPRGRELDSQRDSTSNVLSLCFTLIDGKQHVFRYPVGKMIKYRKMDVDTRRANDTELGGIFAKTDVSLELDLIVDAPFYEEEEVPNLPYAQPTGTGSFDAEVEPWGDEENVDVPM